MRHDESQSVTFANSTQWDEPLSRFVLYERNREAGATGFRINSFSGYERNRFFLNSQQGFQDATLVSGADFLEDGRGFAMFDFDQDGFVDIGLNSTQSPRFRMMRNQMKSRAGNRKAIFVNLVGGAADAQPQNEWSSRDPFGARIIVEIGPQKRAFLLSCGEGLSVQNSRWIPIGMGDAEQIDRIEVHWPSGKTTSQENVAAGSRITLHERPTE